MAVVTAATVVAEPIALDKQIHYVRNSKIEVCLAYAAHLRYEQNIEYSYVRCHVVA